MAESKTIVLSAGGTGGHVFPAAALARELTAQGHRVEVITDARGKKFADAFGGVKLHVIPAGTLGAGIMGKVKGLIGLAAGVVQSFFLLNKIKPDAVIGFGGYPSFPGVFAAQWMGVPTVLHEQNAVLGKANKMLTGKAAQIALSLPGALSGDPRVVVTGNPVRAEIGALAAKPYVAPEVGGKLNLFVMGGSLGATVFSKVVPAALAQLPPSDRARLQVTQQCRADDLPAVRAAYDQAGIKARLEPFFNDVADVLAATHLVISRSGASTVAEVAAAGRPAIFVPYPHHADQQQKVNADAIANTGGAWVMVEKDFNAAALLPRLAEFLRDPQILARAAENARGAGKPDATRRLADVVMKVAR